MSLHVECARCDEELNEPGAILFGPPDSDGLLYKRHLCSTCYWAIANKIEGVNQ